MSTKTKSEIKTYFESGDVPTQQEFENLVDTCANADIPQVPYSAGGDHNLNNPVDDTDMAVVDAIVPMENDEVPGKIDLFIGNYKWSYLGGVDWVAQDIGTTYADGIKFKSPGNNNWENVLVPDGSYTFTLPNSGGTFTFFVTKKLWEEFFIGNASDIIITMDGSVYRDDTSPSNLVNDYLGKSQAEIYPLLDAPLDGGNHTRKNGDWNDIGELKPMPFTTGVDAKLREPKGVTASPTPLQAFPVAESDDDWVLYIGANEYRPNNFNIDADYLRGFGESADYSAGVYFYANKPPWTTFSTTLADNQIHTIYLPAVAGEFNTGGSISFFWLKKAWEDKFSGNNSLIVIAQDCSVYKDSIAIENLVVDARGATLNEAPQNGGEYVRKDRYWVPNSGGSFPEAPIDGNIYGRKDADWDEVVKVVVDVDPSDDNQKAIASSHIMKMIGMGQYNDVGANPWIVKFLSTSNVVSPAALGDWGNPAGHQITIPRAGYWDILVRVTVDLELLTLPGEPYYFWQTSLSTSQNSESDAAFSVSYFDDYSGKMDGYSQSFLLRKRIYYGAPTTLYLIMKWLGGLTSNFSTRGSVGGTEIIAVQISE